MIDLITQCAASKMTGLPVTLTHVRTLQSFDGPLLAEFRSERGDPYLYYWCDRADDIDRWMVLRTLPQDLARYLLRLASLREVITKSPERYMFLVDLDRDDREQASYLVKVESLPEQYLPTEESFFDAAAESESGKQELFVGEHWGPEQVTESSRRYQNVVEMTTAVRRIMLPDADKIAHLCEHLDLGWKPGMKCDDNSAFRRCNIHGYYHKGPEDIPPPVLDAAFADKLMTALLLTVAPVAISFGAHNLTCRISIRAGNGFDVKRFDGYGPAWRAALIDAACKLFKEKL